VGLHEIKKLLHNKINDHQIKEAAHKIRGNLCQPYIWLITRIYRELNLNFPKINDPMKKWTNELNRTFSKEKNTNGQNHMKKCSTSLAIKEMQIKTSPVRMATIKNTNNNKCWQGCGDKGTFIYCWW
jgi:hypothetical protein